MNESERKVEAVLFAVGKEITEDRIAVLCSMDLPKVKKILIGLEKQYSSSDNSIILVKKENGWKLTVKDSYVPLVSSIVSSTELDRPLMDTLAVIAWKYPVVQSDIIKLRNASAYEHMKQLEEQGFIVKERFGRTFKVKLTKKFFEYFDLPSEEAKKAFLSQVPKEVLKEAEEVGKEADEVERLVELDKNKDNVRNELKDAMAEVKKA